MLALNVSVLILCIDNVENSEGSQIAEIFKRIDEHTKNLHVSSRTYLNQSRS